MVTHQDHVTEVIEALQSEPPKIPGVPQSNSSHGLDPSVMTAVSFIPSAYEALFAESSLYLALTTQQLPRLLSAHSLKLSVKQTLEAKEVSLEAILKHFEIPPSHILVFLSMLGSVTFIELTEIISLLFFSGGHILTDEDLSPYFQQKLNAKLNKEGEFDWPLLLKEIASVVKDIPNDILTNPEVIGERVFKEAVEGDTENKLVKKFTEQFNYFKKLSEVKPSDVESFAQLEDVLVADDDERSNATPAIKRFAALGVSLSQLPSVISSLSESFKPAIFKVDESMVKVATERHKNGQMHPWVLSVLTRGEIKLPVCIEPHACVQNVNATSVVPVEEVPPFLVQLYRPLRQNAYAVIFDITTKPQSDDSESNDKGNEETKTDTKDESKANEDIPSTEKGSKQCLKNSIYLFCHSFLTTFSYRVCK